MISLIVLSLISLLAAAPAGAAIINVSVAPGETLTFTRSTADPDQIAGYTSWAHDHGGFQLVATINFDPSRPAEQWYKYIYDISAENGMPLKKALSHVIIGVTDPSSKSDFVNASPAISDGPKLWHAQPNNQYMPDPPGLYGLKWNAASGGTFHLEFYSYKQPVWGDFYARNGGGTSGWNAAYNANFGLEPGLGATDFSGWIPRPDGGGPGPVPAPSTILLMASGCIALALWRWRRPARAAEEGRNIFT
jgi:hypothetical protein